MYAYTGDDVHRCRESSRCLRQGKYDSSILDEYNLTNNLNSKALDLWMAGCMVFVFAALAEFVVVKVLDVQYQQQTKQTSKTILPLRLTSTIEKGQCQTVAMFDGQNVRSRKANAQNTPTAVGQV